MSRTRFSDRQLADLIMELNGEVEPVGESHTDEKRFSNLLKLLNTVDILLDEIYFVVPNKDRPEWSMSHAGLTAWNWFDEKGKWIQEVTS
jgi:hypothetical protein